MEAFDLKPAAEFNYLSGSKCFELEGVDNAEEFARTRRAMGIVGISDDDQEKVRCPPRITTALVKVDTNCTALSLMPTVNGNTVRSFSTHGHQSAAKGSSTTVSRSDIRLILTF